MPEDFSLVFHESLDWLKGFHVQLFHAFPGFPPIFHGKVPTTPSGGHLLAGLGARGKVCGPRHAEGGHWILGKWMDQWPNQ